MTMTAQTTGGDRSLHAFRWPVRLAVAVFATGSVIYGLWAVDSLHRDALWLATLFAAANFWAVMCTAVVVVTRTR